MAMIAVAVLVGVWPAATSLAPSCSKMKSNDLFDSSRGGLNSRTLAPRSPKSCRVSTFSLIAIASAAAAGDRVGPPRRRWSCRLTTKLWPTNAPCIMYIRYVPEKLSLEVIDRSWRNTEVTRRRVVG